MGRQRMRKGAKNLHHQGSLVHLRRNKSCNVCNADPYYDAPTFAISVELPTPAEEQHSRATVYFSDAANASVNPTSTTTTDATGNYSKTMPNGAGMWQHPLQFLPSSDQTATVNVIQWQTSTSASMLHIPLLASAGTGGSISQPVQYWSMVEQIRHHNHTKQRLQHRQCLWWMNERWFGFQLYN